MFNRAWLTVAGIALLIGLVSGRLELSILGVVLLAVVGVSWGWNRWSLSAVEYSRRLSERRAFVGETITLELSLANRKLLPLSWLRVEDECPMDLTYLDVEPLPSSQESIGYLTSLLSLRWFERVRWRVRLVSKQRGYYHLGPARLYSGDLFGLFSRQVTVKGRDRLIVYPRVYTIEAMGLPAKEPFGDSRSTLHMLEDPSRTVGIRDFAPGDPLRRVHWKATARRQQLQARVYEPTTHQQLLICLNVATLPYQWQGSIPELLEQAISVAGSLATYGVEHRYEVGLVANGCWPLSDQPLKVLPGRSPYQLAHILEALAAVSPLPTSRLADLLLKTSARLPWGATLAVVSAVVDDELLEALSRLQVAGRRIVLFSLDCRGGSRTAPTGMTDDMGGSRTAPTRAPDRRGGSRTAPTGTTDGMDGSRTAPTRMTDDMGGSRTAPTGITDDMGGSRTAPTRTPDRRGGSRTAPAGMTDGMGGSRTAPTRMTDDMSGSRTAPTGITDDMGGSRTAPTGITDDMDGSRTAPTRTPDRRGGSRTAPTGVTDGMDGSRTAPTGILCYRLVSQEGEAPLRFAPWEVPA